MFPTFDLNEKDSVQTARMRELVSPNQIDHQVRDAIGLLWGILPKERRNVDEVERQLHRIVDRALRDLREDFDHYFFFIGEDK